MNKTYLRYEEADKFGLIASSKSNIVGAQRGKLLFTGGVQDVLLWNVAKGEVEHVFRGDTKEPCEVTCLCLRNDEKHIAAGYSDGIIRIWDIETKDLIVKFNGHARTITCLAYNKDSSLLGSGSQDTDVIVWDTVALTGRFKLKGHNDQVTEVRFLESTNQLLSSSKDTLMKLWDLDTQHCAHTIVGHRSAVWSFDVNESESLVWTGSMDNTMRCVYRLDEQARNKEIEESGGKATVIETSLVTDKSSSNEAETEVNEKKGEEIDFKVVTPKLAGEPWRVLGEVQRQTNERVSRIRYSPGGKFLACQAAGKVVELFRVRSENEIKQRAKRRVRRMKEKLKGSKGNDDESALASAAQVQASDMLEHVCVVRTNNRVSSFCFGQVKSSPESFAVELILGLNTNNVDVYNVSADIGGGADGEEGAKKRKLRDAVELTRVRGLELPGHRTDPRAMAISNDDSLLLTASNGEVKLWNLNTFKSIRTSRCGYALCCAFVPGNTHALVGTKTGNLLLYSLTSGELLSDTQAHEGAIWSLDIRPDGSGFVTGGADQQVKFWEFELVKPAEEESDSSDDDSSDSSDDDEPSMKKPKKASTAIAKKPVLQVVLVRTLKMSEGVLCVKFSHHRAAAKLLLAVSLLDSTVKIFFDDSLKFSLSLYGHKLPVLSMDISSDNTLIATASADKNVKLWGLDFGDCHKSLFAHDSSVMAVRFVPNTHYMFTVSKDQRVRYWDADKFELIQTMEMHVGEVWGLAVSSDGSFLASSGHDKTIRMWRRTDEPLFLEDEREMELERVFDKKLDEARADPSKQGTAAIPAIQAEHAADEAAVESFAAGKRSSETVRAGERLIEAIAVATNERRAQAEYAEAHTKALAALSKAKRKERTKLEAAGKDVPVLVPKPQPNLLLLGRSPLAHISHVLTGIPANEREEALMVLPFASVIELLGFLLEMIKLSWHLEVAVNAALYLTKIHFKQIVATHSLKQIMNELRDNIRPQLSKLRDRVGINMAGVSMLKTHIEHTTSRTFVG